MDKIHTLRVGSIIFVFLLSGFLALQAQESGQARFRGGAVLGLTASQIDGDESAGYNKLGLQAGLKTSVRLKKKSDASLEILYSQRGAQSLWSKILTLFSFP